MTSCHANHNRDNKRSVTYFLLFKPVSEGGNNWRENSFTGRVSGITRATLSWIKKQITDMKWWVTACWGRTIRLPFIGKASSFQPIKAREWLPPFLSLQKNNSMRQTERLSVLDYSFTTAARYHIVSSWFVVQVALPATNPFVGFLGLPHNPCKIFYTTYPRSVFIVLIVNYSLVISLSFTTAGQRPTPF